MRRANSLVMEVLLSLEAIVKQGIKVNTLEEKACELTKERGGIPAFKGYNGYPSALCVSVDEVVIHGIPNNRTLRDGEIVGLDFGVVLDGFYGDAAITVSVGKISEEASKLIEVTKAALYEGIGYAKPGNRIGDISSAVQTYVESNGFSVVREFTGHGIGRNLHEEPSIPNFGKAGTGIVIEKGMTFAIEPMVIVGSHEIEILSDGWTAVTLDRSLSAHFEHTIAVSDNKAEILSRFPS